MKDIRRALSRAEAMIRGHRSAEADLRAEMEAHLQMEIDENIRRGMQPDEARRRAMIASGGLAQAAENVHDQRGLPWMESIAADLRFAIRHFRRTPLSTITMILVLALGIGINVVLFTVLSSIVTLPAPGLVRDESMVRIRGTLVTNGTATETRLLSWPEVEAFAARTDVFSSVAAHAEETAVVYTDEESSTTASLIYATSNYLNILAIRPALGAPPAADEGIRMTTSPAAMISYAMWQQRFGGTADVIGRTIRVNDVPIQVVGVAPQRFLGTDGGRALTVWLPLAAYPIVQKRSAAVFSSPDSAFLSASARLRPGASTSSASAIVAGLAGRASGVDSTGADVVPMLAANSHIGDRRDTLVSAAAGGTFALLALLITCTNVSALTVGLAAARRKEIGVRLSLGAPRKRIIRQLLTESVLLAAVAAAVALLLTMAGIQAISTRLEDVQLVVDWRVTVATCAFAILTGILFGLSPALHATRVSLGEVLKSASTGIGSSRSRLQQTLVVAQVAFTQPLLVGLGVLIVTMVSDVGSRATSAVPEQIAEVELDTWAGRVTPEERAARVAAVVARVAGLPGVVSAMPMQLGAATVPLAVHPADRVAGIPYPASMDARFTAAPRGYFEAFEIPIVRGRNFDASEYVSPSHDPADVVKVNRVIIGSDLARRLWGSNNPIGRRLAIAVSSRSDSLAMVVVGVVDEKAAGSSDVYDLVRVYVPYSQINSGVIARTSGPALPLLNTIRSAVAAEAPQMPIYRAETMQQREAALRADLMRASGAIAGGGLLALILSAIGLYAVVSFAVGQRTREIGIRTALGAQRGQVVRMFFTNGLILCAIGLALGLPLSMIATRLISKSLNWPITTSPLIGAAIALVVLLVASLAVWFPARRASTIDPLVALRTE